MKGTNIQKEDESKTHPWVFCPPGDNPGTTKEENTTYTYHDSGHVEVFTRGYYTNGIDYSVCGRFFVRPINK